MAAFSIKVGDKSVDFEFSEVLARTGTNTPLLWIAASGERRRGVIIKISDMLKWTLTPKPSAEEITDVAARLGAGPLTVDIGRIGLDAFFKDDADFELLLTTHNAPKNWR